MKILCVIDSLACGGAQRQMTYLIRGLKESGHDVSIFVIHPGHNHFRADIESIGIPIFEYSRNKYARFSLLVLWKLYFRLVKSKCTIISFLPAANFYSSIVKLFKPSTHLIVSQRTSSAASLSVVRKWMLCFTCFCASNVTTNSKTETGILRKTFPRLAYKIHTVWNGYEINKFDEIRYQNQEIRKLLVVGRIAYPKNGLNILKGLSVFLSRHGWAPEIHWAGRKEIDKRSLVMQSEMECFIEVNPEVKPYFKLLGEVRNIEELYKSYDALLHISLYEGFPNVICEAMFLGCPVIASNVCDHPIVIDQEKRGLLCEPDSPESIADAIERLEQMAIDKRNEMILNARKFAEDNFDIGHLSRSYEKLITGDCR